MKQVIQSFRTGELTVLETPSPALRPQGVLVRTAASLVSAGTERMVVEFAEKNLVQKAKARPDLVRQVVDKAQREGVVSTIERVRNRLDQPLPLGYSSAGVVVEVGADALGFQVGDRVACAGGGFASHAELVYVPRTLAVPVPEHVSFDAAAFTTLGAIALQGIRQGEVVLGQRVAVIGLGLLGQLSVQILKAAGCRVFGIDLNPQRVELALELGADAASTNGHAISGAPLFTAGRGFDTVLIAADTKSSEPVALAGDIARDRAIVVAVGAVGMEIPRKVYYEKELDFRLSRSYGPGRYDAEYEEKGRDYPVGYVRWTEQRNMEAFVEMLAAGSLKVEPLISHRFRVEQAAAAYEVITGKRPEPFLGVVLTYDTGHMLPSRVTLSSASRPSRTSDTLAVQSSIRLGLLGAGNFVNATLLPALKDIAGLELVGVVSGSGLSARAVGDRFGFDYCASDASTLVEDTLINWIAIATRHDLHARQAVAAFEAGKDVFVEKPLALNPDELSQVVLAQQGSGRRLMVGFNRRFAPLVREMADFVARHQRPLVASYRINAGAIPGSHWTQDAQRGGGRVIGEGCHFIDLLQFLIGAPPVEVYATAIQSRHGPVEDEVVIQLRFLDGSVGTVIYAAGGDRAFGRERIELIGDGKVAVLDDFRELELVSNGHRSRRKERLRADKGHAAEWQALVDAVKTGANTPVSLDEIVTAHLATFAAVDSLRGRRPVAIDAAGFWEAIGAESR